MLEAHRRQRADMAKAVPRVQRDRPGLLAVGDDAQHLAPGTGLAAGDQGGQQRTANPATLHGACDVDRILEGVAVGRALAVGARIAIADHLAGALGDEVGQAAGEDRGAPREQHLRGRRHLLEAGQAMQHLVGVDGLDGRHVLLGRIPDQHIFRPAAAAGTSRWRSWSAPRHPSGCSRCSGSGRRRGRGASGTAARQGSRSGRPRVSPA